MQYAADIIPVCDLCKAHELKSCAKCGVEYCQHFSSEIDIRFCGNCMVDFKVNTMIEIRTTEKLAQDGTVVYSKREHCKRLKLEGTDWLFTANKISSLNDDDLDATIEYHRAIAGMMLSEREERRVEKYQKLKQTAFVLGPRPEADSTGAIKGSLKTPKQIAANKTDKRVSTKKVNSNSVGDAMNLLLKSGMSLEQILAMAGKGK